MPMPAERPPIRTTGRSAALLALVLVSACGQSAAEVRAARTHGYKADFALVFNQVVAAVRQEFHHYPEKVEEDPVTGTIETAWLPVHQTQGGDDRTVTDQQREKMAADDRAQGKGSVFTGSSQDRTAYYLRYEVHVVGGDPWRVVILGRARRWNAGDAKAVELKGADEPPWLKGRVDSLYVSIYHRLKRYSVPLQVTVADDRPPPTKKDLTRFGDIPPAAADVIEEVRRAAADRALDRVRAFMVDDFEWSLGADPDADQAMATWQADGSVVSTLVDVLQRGCHADSPTRVSCPPEFSQQVGYLGWRATFELRGAHWRMTSFLSGD